MHLRPLRPWDLDDRVNNLACRKRQQGILDETDGLNLICHLLYPYWVRRVYAQSVFLSSQECVGDHQTVWLFIALHGCDGAMMWPFMQSHRSWDCSQECAGDYRAVWLLLEFMGALERNIFHAAEGSEALLELPAPVLAFFVANRKVIVYSCCCHP